MIDNSAHDSICGCSHDLVTAQVIGRYAEAEQIATGIVRSTLRRIADIAPIGTIAVVNPSPGDREALIELDVAVPAGWASVALQAGDQVLATQEVGRADPVIASLRMPASEIGEFFRRRRHGRELLGRMINGIEIDADAGDETAAPGRPGRCRPGPARARYRGTPGHGRRRSPTTDPDVIWEVVVRAPDRRLVVARVPAPALGWATVNEIDAAGVLARADPEPGPRIGPRARQRPRRDRHREATGRSGWPGRVRRSLALGGSSMVANSGIATTTDHPSATRWLTAHRPSSCERSSAGPIRGVVEIVRTYAWPKGVEPDGSARTSDTVPTEVTTRLELRADEPFVRIRIEFENRSRDHRVRWHVPLPAPVDGSSAEGQFAVVKRGLTVEGDRGEVPLPTFPASGFIHVDGLSVLLDQVTEYEVLDGTELALTVLRSFGLISRNANPYREDPAGPEIRVPEAQLIGSRTFQFGLYPHAGSWEAADTLGAIETYRHPFMTTRATGTPAPSGDTARFRGSRTPADRAVAGPRITGQGVVMTALRRRGPWLEVRLVNEGSTTTRAEVRRQRARSVRDRSARPHRPGDPGGRGFGQHRTRAVGDPHHRPAPALTCYDNGTLTERTA